MTFLTSALRKWAITITVSLAIHCEALIISPANTATTSNVAEVVRLRFSPPHPEVSRLLLLPAPAEVVIKAPL